MLTFVYNLLCVLLAFAALCVIIVVAVAVAAR